jgi:glutamyl-tRNA synthetase
MRNERFDGIESKNRNASIEKNLELFEEMKRGTQIVLLK